MSIETIERDFHQKISAKVRLAPEGMKRFRVFTPFLFEDGDLKITSTANLSRERRP